MKERLAKILANAGVASRRRSEELIAAGKITVNGKVAAVGEKFDADVDEIYVDGRKLTFEEEKVYYLLNKPKGYISTAKDERNRKTVVSLLPQDCRIYPIGRLDNNTEGLLLLTNDGELTNFLIHPKYEVEKTYVAKVAGEITEDKLKILREGVALEDGVTAPAKVRILEETGKLELTIHEGKNREVRRMLAAVGLDVLALKRTHFAGLTLKGVARGKYRKLTNEEVRALYERFADSGYRRRRGGNDGGDNGG
ncbi:MAG: rRNA pseudouridine synthase [Selenomonadaceae bacterium]|nr:rRNA pseudouridine synthase [Selenomonadaceae bacterium]